MSETSPNASKKKENIGSSLLSSEENALVFGLLGGKCQSLAAAVVQLYTTLKPDHSQWIYRDTGVVCLVKDPAYKAYFFRVYCLRRKCRIWEQQLYRGLQYKVAQFWLHTFEAEGMIAAFNFADEGEADKFLKAVLGCIHNVEQQQVNKIRREESRRRSRQYPQQQIHLSVSPSGRDGGDESDGGLPRRVSTARAFYNSFMSMTGKTAQKESNYTKRDIGQPFDYRHVAHVGFNPDDKTFYKNIDFDKFKEEKWIRFFEKAGVTEDQLSNRATLRVIDNFMSEHGGMAKIDEEVEDSPLPVRAAKTRGTILPPRGQHLQVPVLPPRSDKQLALAAPAPPPLPGMLAVPSPPPSAQPLQSSQTLLSEIRTGINLRHVEDDEERPSAAGDTRDALLSDIRKGRELKKVVPATRNSNPSRADHMADALRMALSKRLDAMGGNPDLSDDGDDSDTSRDSEWDD